MFHRALTFQAVNLKEKWRRTEMLILTACLTNMRKFLIYNISNTVPKNVRKEHLPNRKSEIGN